MGATAHTIWQVPAYLPYVQPSLTAEAVAAAEHRIGYKLPAEYLELLKIQNGGYIRFSLPECVHEMISGIGPYFPSLTEFDWDEFQEYVSYPLQGLVPFDGDGHWYLCFDYRVNQHDPSVAHVDIECDAEGTIADSFAQYLDMLRVEVEDEFVLEAGVNSNELERAIEQSLGVVFENHGHVGSWLRNTSSQVSHRKQS